MKNITVARRYAKALYELSVETKSLDDVVQGMKNINTALEQSLDLSKVLFNPLVKPEEKQNIVKSISSNKLILKFVLLLAKRKRLDLITEVTDQLVAFSDQANGINRVMVKTAVSLSDKQKRVIEKNLSSTVGGTIIGKFEVAKDLIGGVWVKMGDKVLDATLKGRIDDLRHTLIHSSN